MSTSLDRPKGLLFLQPVCKARLYSQVTIHKLKTLQNIMKAFVKTTSTVKSMGQETSQTQDSVKGILKFITYLPLPMDDR